MKFDADSSETSCIVWVCEHSSWFFGWKHHVFFIFTKHVKGVHIILSYLHVLFQNISSEMSTKKNVDRKNHAWQAHPSATFWSRSSPIMGGAVVKNYLGQLTNITLSKIDSVEGGVFAPKLQNFSKIIWFCLEMLVLLLFSWGCLGKSPRSLLCLTLEESPSGNENGLGFCVPKNDDIHPPFELTTISPPWK